MLQPTYLKPTCTEELNLSTHAPLVWALLTFPYVHVVSGPYCCPREAPEGETAESREISSQRVSRFSSAKKFSESSGKLSLLFEVLFSLR